MKYKVMDRETNNSCFGEFATREEAEQFISECEEQDALDGVYTNDYYQVVYQRARADEFMDFIGKEN